MTSSDHSSASVWTSSQSMKAAARWKASRITSWARASRSMPSTVPARERTMGVSDRSKASVALSRPGSAITVRPVDGDPAT